MKNKFLTTFFLTCVAFSSAYAENSDIAGQYSCKISRPGSSKQFPGHLVVQKVEQVYKFDWQFAKKANFKGTALWDKASGTVAVVSSRVENPEKISLTTFTVAANGDLNGQYVAKDSTEVGLEVCNKDTTALLPSKK